MIVVDTNVVSELMRPSPSAHVIEWVQIQNKREMYTTAITWAEIRYGIERLPEGGRKELLRRTANEVFAGFVAKVLPFDVNAATEYGPVVCRREQAGLAIEGFDAQIACICLSHRATLATRNFKDFVGVGVEVVNPWREV